MPHSGFALKRPLALVLAIMIILASTPSGFSSTRTNQTTTITTRVVPLTIKTVLLGFDPQTIDQNYLTWKGNLAENSINTVLSNGNITGVTYDLSYQFVFTTPDFQRTFTKFLRSIQKDDMDYNPWFRATSDNYFYDAAKVENWLLNSNSSYGGMPAHGYTFVFTNLTSIPSITENQLQSDDLTDATPHYYQTPYTDRDLNYTIRYRDFSVAWGGKNRLWFMDMSAGPDFWTWSSSEGVPHLPLQIATDLFKVDIHTPYGKQWLTQLLSDYIYEAVLNLAVPAFVYQPVYSQTYRIVVDVIDNRTDDEKQAVPIENTIHPGLIKAAFRDLLPYSDIVVQTRIISASRVPDLQSAIIKATVIPPSDLAIGSYVDTRPIYKYLQDHLSDMVGKVRRDAGEFTIPVFAFAFHAGIYFGYTNKWYIANLDESNFMGISLGDMVLIGVTQSEFQKGDNVDPPQPGTGLGFTQTVIHEAGHEIGLMHPHQYGSLEDFVSSAMSYWSWEYKFSQFDKDSIRRSHSDQLILETATRIADTRNALNSRFDFGTALSQLASAESYLNRALGEYDSMHYAEAAGLAVLALQSATAAFTSASTGPSSLVTVALISLILGIVIGASLIFVALRKYVHEVAERK